MPVYVKGTNIRIRGTYEHLYGVAQVIGLEEDGTPVYGDQGTEVFWDCIETVRRKGELVFLDTDGDEHLASEVEQRDGELEDEDEEEEAE